MATAKKGKKSKKSAKKSGKKSAKKPAKKMKKAAPKKAKKASKRKPNAAFMKAMTPTAVLAAVVGSMPLPRTEVTKRIWDYIKKNRLQDTINKRLINADEKLRQVFGGKRQVSMFEMTKLVSNHLKEGKLPHDRTQRRRLRAPARFHGRPAHCAGRPLSFRG